MSLLKVENRGPVTVFTIDNAAKRNVISQATAVDLQRAFEEFDRSDQRVAIITGAGDEAFTAGADLRDIPEFWRCTPGAGIATDKPIIAAVAGWCIGGGITLVGMCDLAVAADNAKFSYPEARLGFTQGFITGIAARIPHKIAMEVMLLGRTFDAQRAHAAGLVNEVVPTGKQVEVALGALRAARDPHHQALRGRAAAADAVAAVRAHAATDRRAEEQRRLRGRHAGVPREAPARVQGPLKSQLENLT